MIFYSPLTFLCCLHAKVCVSVCENPNRQQGKVCTWAFQPGDLSEANKIFTKQREPISRKQVAQYTQTTQVHSTLLRFRHFLCFMLEFVHVRSHTDVALYECVTEQQFLMFMQEYKVGRWECCCRRNCRRPVWEQANFFFQCMWPLCSCQAWSSEEKKTKLAFILLPQWAQAFLGVLIKAAWFMTQKSTRIIQTLRWCFIVRSCCQKHQTESLRHTVSSAKIAVITEPRNLLFWSLNWFSQCESAERIFFCQSPVCNTTLESWCFLLSLDHRGFVAFLPMFCWNTTNAFGHGCQPRARHWPQNMVWKSGRRLAEWQTIHVEIKQCFCQRMITKRLILTQVSPSVWKSWMLRWPYFRWGKSWRQWRKGEKHRNEKASKVLGKGNGEQCSLMDTMIDKLSASLGNALTFTNTGKLLVDKPHNPEVPRAWIKISGTRGCQAMSGEELWLCLLVPARHTYSHLPRLLQPWIVKQWLPEGFSLSGAKTGGQKSHAYCGHLDSAWQSAKKYPKSFWSFPLKTLLSSPGSSLNDVTPIAHRWIWQLRLPEVTVKKKHM